MVVLYFKLIFSIVFSPIVFALGAIPGNESTSQNYLKQWVSYVAGVAGLNIFVTIVDLIVIMLILSPTNIPSAGTVTAAVFAVVFCPVILIFGYIQALKVPNKLNEYIMGEAAGGKPKRR
jgi:hypothetical protein